MSALRRHWSAAAAFAGSLAVYVLTLCPTVYVEGSGELIGAVHFLGTAHPTGYPLFCLVGRLFSATASATDVAWRVNLASAFTAALAAAALAELLRSRGLSAWTALGAGLAFAWSRTFWSQAVIAEVYGLSLALALVAMAVGLRAAQTRQPRWLLLTGWAMGLGLLAHLNQALLWPGLVLLLAWRWPELGRRPGLLLGAGLAALAAYSLVLYLPLRAAAGPGFHWGPLHTPGQLWDHVTAALYRSSFLSLPLAGMGRNAGRWVVQLRSEFHVLLLPLAAWGLWLTWRRDRSLLLVAGLGALCDLAVVLSYHRDPNGIGVFFLLGHASLALFLGYGLDDVGRRLGPAGPVLTGVLAAAVVLQANWSVCDRSHMRVAHDYGRDILDGLPRRAVLLSEGDDASFIVDYLQRIEGMRPDVSVYNRLGRGTDLVPAAPDSLGPRQRAALEMRAEAELVLGSGRPVFVLAPRVMPVPGHSFAPEGLAYRIVLPTTPVPLPAVPMGNARPQGPDCDAWVRKLQANYFYMEAERLLALGQTAPAHQAYLEASRVAFDSRTMRHNVGLALLRMGDLDLARREAEAAVALDPWQEDPHRLLAAIARRAGGGREAEDLLE